MSSRMLFTDRRQASAAGTLITGNSYLTSGADPGNWGQPSLGNYVVVLEGADLRGQLIGTNTNRSDTTQHQSLSAELRREFADWDELSDEVW